MLTATGLACNRGERRLFEGVSFTLPAGMLLHVQGANGSGKTSLLRLVCGLSSPASGVIAWRGAAIDKCGEEYCRDIAYIGHSLGVADEMNALENLRFAMQFGGETVTRQRAESALFSLGLTEYSQLPAKVLSHGQKRRVALARLLLTRKPLWILDEPFTALDAEAVALIEKVLEQHLRGGGIALLTTHQEFKINPAACGKAIRLGH